MRRIVHGSHEKACVRVTVWKSGDVYAAAFSVGVGRHVDFVIGVFDDLRVCGQGVDIVLYFSEFAASGAVFGDEVAV